MSKSAHIARFSKRQPGSLNSGCRSGAFYKSPKKGDDIDTSSNIEIEWDTSLNCFSTKGVDIYLYAPYTSKGLLHVWGGVDYNAGKFNTELVGSWWNSTVAPISLQLAFVEAGTPIFTSAISQGPIFSATFNTTDYGIKHPTGGTSPTTDTTSLPDSSGNSIFQAVNSALKATGLSKGSIAAAVLIPLLAIGIAIAIYVRFQRRKEAEKRKRWSQAVDKRMSTISTEWKTLPPNAQSEAIRQSIAIMRNSRASMARMSQIYADGRPSSTFTVEGAGAAGVGVRKGTGVGPRNVSMGPAEMANRKSAISFATDTRFSRSSTDIPDVPKINPRPSTDRSRPSTETQRGRASRAFHTAISANYDDFDVKDFDLMSPIQKGGPAVLNEKDLKPLDLSKDANVLPALNLINHTDTSNEIIFLAQSPMEPSYTPISPPPPTKLSPTTAAAFSDSIPYSPAYANLTHAPAASPVNSAPIPPAVTPVTATSPANSFSPFMRGPSNAMSPDDMLRAYAAREQNGRNSPRPGTPMQSVAARGLSRTPSSPSVKGKISYPITEPTKISYPAFDAPATPEPVRDIDITPGLPPAGRTLYQPGQQHSQNRVSQYNDDDAYGGFGTAS